MKLTPDLLLVAYRNGIFPMAEPDEGDAVYWYAPDPRAILPLDAYHCPSSLRRTIKQEPFEIRCDSAFERVMRICAKPREESPGTWISEEFIRVYTALHEQGHAHSVECWQDGELVGGLYGVSVGAAFMGESMFHRVRDASKVALYYLVQRLRERDFRLLDVQFRTTHLARFGVIEISRDAYEDRLAQAVTLPRSFA